MSTENYEVFASEILRNPEYIFHSTTCFGMIAYWTTIYIVNRDKKLSNNVGLFAWLATYIVIQIMLMWKLYLISLNLRFFPKHKNNVSFGTGSS